MRTRCRFRGLPRGTYNRKEHQRGGQLIGGGKTRGEKRSKKTPGKWQEDFEKLRTQDQGSQWSLQDRVAQRVEKSGAEIEGGEGRVKKWNGCRVDFLGYGKKKKEIVRSAKRGIQISDQVRKRYVPQRTNLGVITNGQGRERSKRSALGER